ncbi:MAG TPA: mevalonate kinase [Candidatus Bathyarchaeia archaeon]
MSNGVHTDVVAKALAPGKIILTGEHFVVLGAPAVAMAVDLHAHAIVGPARPGKIEVGASIPLHLLGHEVENGGRLDTKRLLEPLRLAARETLDYIGERRSGVTLDVYCEIPVGAGLGSSASITVATITAVAKAKGAKLTREESFKIAFGPESYLHGKPSGVDHAASIFGGAIKFTRPNIIKLLKLNTPPHVLVCDTGIHRSTKKLVGAVVRKSQLRRQLFDVHLDEVREISESAVRALNRGDDEELGALMNRNQKLLVEIGVSHPKLEQLVKVAREKGALGAKLTGAGAGGCIIALCHSDKDEASIARALKRHGGIPYMVTMDPEGARAVSTGTVLK